jgi:hypothetical protein
MHSSHGSPLQLLARARHVSCDQTPERTRWLQGSLQGMTGNFANAYRARPISPCHLPELRVDVRFRWSHFFLFAHDSRSAGAFRAGICTGHRRVCFYCMLLSVLCVRSRCLTIVKLHCHIVETRVLSLGVRKSHRHRWSSVVCRRHEVRKLSLSVHMSSRVSRKGALR